ncbi:MAG: hypothetical protein ABH846_01465 [Patescibacteria group bacterium]
MKKIFLLSVLLICVLTFTGGGCFNKGGDSAGGSSDSWTGSLTDALQLGKSMKCTWSDDEGEGTSYIKGEKVYTETTYQGKTSYMIGDGECTYTWEEGASEGMEFCYSADDFDVEADAEDYEDTDDYEDLMGSEAGVDMDIDMNCSPAVIKDSKFVPPSDVEFSDPFADLMDAFEDFDFSGLEGLEGLEF